MTPYRVNVAAYSRSEALGGASVPEPALAPAPSTRPSALTSTTVRGGDAGTGPGSTRALLRPKKLPKPKRRRDGVDAPDLSFFSTQPVIDEIERELTAFGDLME